MLATFRYPKDFDKIKERLPFGLEANPRAAEAAASIITAVQERGDEALLEYTAKFDGVELNANELRLPIESLQEAWEAQSPEFRKAVEFASKRIRDFHEAQLPTDICSEQPDGSVLKRVYRPLNRVGVYVPGGSAAYPSTAMMDIIPAQVAGVTEIVVATPPQREDGPQADSTLAVLHHLGIKEVYTVGGAQALAALALGTATISPVDKIVGPGNAFVNEAKRLLYGAVDIDSLAGPSEILVIADSTARAEYVAADLLSQAEHSPDAQALLLVVGDESMLQKITDEVKRQAELLPRVDIVGESLDRFGTAILVDSIDQAIEVANWKAPEHLEILTRDAAEVAERIKNAGAIFVGEYTPEAVCDYVAGPNHVLPTGGTARFFSGLNTASFMKGMNITQMSREGLKACAPHVQKLAQTEGLDAHARSAAIRFVDGNSGE